MPQIRLFHSFLIEASMEAAKGIGGLVVFIGIILILNALSYFFSWGWIFY